MKNSDKDGIRIMKNGSSMQYYSIKSVARMYETSEKTIRRLIMGKNIRVVRVGRCIRIPESEVQRFATPVQSPVDSLDEWLIE